MSDTIFNSKIIINAPAEMIWDIITDHKHFSLIDRNYLTIDGYISKGKYINIYIFNRKYQTKVKKIIPLKSMTWEYSWLFNLYKIITTFHVIAKDDQTSEFHIEEIFSGYLLNYISKIIPISKRYTQLAEALKKYVEARN